MEPDYRLLETLSKLKALRVEQNGGGSGGGEPPFDQTEQRLQRLERGIAAIEQALGNMAEQIKQLATREDLALVSVKLDGKASSVELVARAGKIEIDLATIAGKLDGKALAVDVAELKGRVSRIPTVPMLTSILVFVSLLFAAATWVFRHLPPAWAAALQ